MVAIEEHLATFRALQRALLNELSKTVDLTREFFNDIPPGEIKHDRKVWSYRGHGRGVAFEHSGVVVDAHVAPSMFDVVDAWRLSLYFDSLGIESVLSGGCASSVTDHESVSALLETLVESGALVHKRVEGVPDQLYVPPQA